MTERPLLAKDSAEVGPASEKAQSLLPDPFEPIGSMRSVAPTVTGIFGAETPADADEPALADVVDHLRGTERLAHIVVDAFGTATWKEFERISHVFNRLASVRLAELQSVLPAITPVNFATIASGASPDKHGITNREQTLTVDTVFARLAEAGIETSVVGRAKSTTGILLSGLSSRPSVAESNTDKEVLDLFVAQVKQGTPYILTQLLDVDEAGHLDGPWGRRSRQAVGRTDHRLRSMLRDAVEHDYALIIHADHGQHDVEDEDNHPKSEERGTHSGRRQEDVRVPFIYLTSEELREAMAK